MHRLLPDGAGPRRISRLDRRRDGSAIDRDGPVRIRHEPADLRRELVFLERHADRDEPDGCVELLEERQLHLDAVLVAVRPDVFLERRLRKTAVQVLVGGDRTERRLPFVVGDRQGRACAVMVRPEDHKRRRPSVRREGRVTVGRDRTGVSISGVRHDQADDPPLSALHLRDATRTERMGVTLPDLAEKGLSRPLVESPRHRRISHARAPSKGRFVIIDRHRKLFVRFQGAAHLQDLPRQEPIHGGQGPSTFVVRRDDEVDVAGLVVRIAQGDDRDADVQRLAESLLVRRRIGDDQHLGLDELREVRIREGARDEPARDAGLLLFLHHAPAWTSSSIRMSSFNFAIRSPPTAPVLMPRHPKATARWAIVSSVVSPDRCDMTVAYPDRWANSTAARVSESVPIWFGLIRIALPACDSIPRRRRSTFVTKMSSPITLQCAPTRFVNSAKAPKSSSSNGSSTLNKWYSRTSRSTRSICSSRLSARSRYRYFPSR